MSVTANILLIKQIESILSNKLPAQSALELVNEIQTILNDYEVEQIRTTHVSKTDNLLQSFISAMRIQGRSEILTQVI